MNYRRILQTVVVGMVFAAPVVAQEEPVQLTFAEKRDCDPSVSPDGNHLAFVSNRTGKFNLYLLTFGDQGVLQVTQSTKDDVHPSWSRDGKKILFSSKRTGNGDIYQMASDGKSGYLQLTDRVEIDDFPSYCLGDEGLVYTSTPKKAFGKVRIKGLRANAQVVKADEKGRANNVRVLADGSEPRLSPNGKQIVFVSHRTKNEDVWLMEADGSVQRQLTMSPKHDIDARFSPDGKHIVFASNRTGNYDIWVMDADGSGQRQLTSGPEDETQPCWSFGGYIYYTRETSSTQSNIYRIKAP